jgi:hypothetical protein
MAAAEELPSPPLSSKDTAVLQALFDVGSSPSATAQIDASLPQLPHIASPSELSRLQQLELEAIRPLQVSDAEVCRTTIEQAVSDLSAIIKSHPLYASAYVNRAQALRLLIADDADRHSSTPSLSTRLFADLARAISLSTPSPATAHVSPLQSQVLANAHTHRAYILYKAARDPATAKMTSLLPDQLRGLASQQLEEMASRDFQLAGRYGSPIARQMAVRTNPYAKMCGAIVKEALREEIAAWGGGLVS